MFQILRRRRSRTYGGTAFGCHPARTRPRHILGPRMLAAACFALLGCVADAAAAKTVEVVAFGDSLMAGYNLPAGAAFPDRLQTALRQDGLDVTITNASVSGDTTAGGLERLDWSVPDGTDGVLLELGANDMLRGQDPALTRQNLAAMIARLKARGIAVYLLGMKADPALGPDYGARFNAIYPDLAKVDGLSLYPFLLDGVAGDPKRQLADGLHPNQDGIAHMVDQTEGDIATWIRTLGGAR